MPLFLWDLKNMKIQIIKAFKYSEDGNNIIVLTPGEHEVADRWASKAINGGFCQAVQAPKENKKPIIRRTKRAVK